MATLRSCAFFVLATSLWSGEPESIDHIRTETSPQNDIIVQHCWKTCGGEQIWLALTNDFSKQRLLFDTGRSAELLFSEDEQWLIINDHWGSNGSSALLYKRVAPLDYRKQLDISVSAWNFFTEHENVAQPDFDHRYTGAIRWIAKPLAVILELSGHSDSEHHVDGWLCIYYIESKKFSTDLDALNKQQVTLQH